MKLCFVGLNTRKLNKGREKPNTEKYSDSEEAFSIWGWLSTV